MAQTHNAAEASVIKTKPALATCEPSEMTRKICAIVSIPKTAPDVMMYAFIDFSRLWFWFKLASRKVYLAGSAARHYAFG